VVQALLTCNDRSQAFSETRKRRNGAKVEFCLKPCSSAYVDLLGKCWCAVPDPIGRDRVNYTPGQVPRFSKSVFQRPSQRTGRLLTSPPGSYPLPTPPSTFSSSLRSLNSATDDWASPVSSTPNNSVPEAAPASPDLAV
jgi:hypothetical protein